MIFPVEVYEIVNGNFTAAEILNAVEHYELGGFHSNVTPEQKTLFKKFLLTYKKPTVDFEGILAVLADNQPITTTEYIYDKSESFLDLTMPLDRFTIIKLLNIAYVAAQLDLASEMKDYAKTLK